MGLMVEEYLREDGSNPYKRWFDGLDARAAAKVTTAKLRLELGNTSRIKWYGGMGEYVIDWGPGYRIYLAKSNNAWPQAAKRRGDFHGTYARFQTNGYRTD